MLAASCRAHRLPQRVLAMLKLTMLHAVAYYQLTPCTQQHQHTTQPC